MLLRQHFVRGDACHGAAAASLQPHSPAFCVFRARRRSTKHDALATASPHAQQTAEHAAESHDAEVAGSWQRVLRDAQPVPPAAAAHPAPTQTAAAAKWSIPLEQWASHPTLLNGCERDRAPLRVAMLLSGGVDSSVALRLAQAAGHHVTAFYLKIWFQDDFRNYWDACPWEEDLAFCQKVCDQAGVPLRTVPLTDAYWERVVAHSIAEIKAGRTPNPDILCNSRVKFGAFLEHLESQHAGQFDRVASGHYAAVSRGPGAGGDSTDTVDNVSSSGDCSGGLAVLHTTPDAVKDQTYFLAHLSQAQLSRAMFPLAPLRKSEVRALAAAAQLPNQARRDSQGICFLGKVQHAEFVREHLGVWPGPFIKEDTGEILGYHQGFWFHTIGQRKGVPLSGGPWYVVRKDVDKNAVYISRHYHAPDRLRNAFRCGPFNWLGGEQPPAERLRRCKVRHGPDSYACRVRFEGPASGSSDATFCGSAAAAERNNCGSAVAADNGCSVAAAAAISNGTGNIDVSSHSSGAGDTNAAAATKHSPTAAALEQPSPRAPSAAAMQNARSAVVTLDGRDQGVAPGQYAVFFDGDVCLGTAVIQGP